MHPVLFEWHGIRLYTYGVFLAIAFAVTYIMTQRKAPALGYTADEMARLFVWMICGGILGARLFYVLQHWNYYQDQLIESLWLPEGGLVWYGGLIGGGLSGISWVKRNKRSLIALSDAIAPYLALAQAIGRFGCFFNGCCFGINGFPIQIVYSAAMLILFGALTWVSRIQKQKGQATLAYLLGYGLFRFVLEFARGDQEHMANLFTIPQILSLGLIIASLIGWIILHRKQKGA